MPIDYKPGNPPNPQGLSNAQMAIFREELQEDTLQTLLSFIDYRTITSQMFVADSVIAGAVGDGVTDDTAALQLMFDTAALVGSKTVSIARGQFRVTAEVVVGQGTSVSYNIQGNQGADRNLDGTVFVYDGSAGGRPLRFRGVNGSVVRDIQIDGGGLAGSGFKAAEYKNGATFIASSGMTFENIVIGNLRAHATTDGIQVGFDDGVNSGLQASEYTFRNVVINGNGSTPGRAAINILTAGNCKNFKVYDLRHAFFDYGWYQPSGSGITTIDGISSSTTGKNTHGYGVYMGSGDALKVSGIAMENDPGYEAGIVFTGNGVSCVIDTGYFAGTLGSDDVVAKLGGPTTIRGFHFKENSRGGANTLYLQLDPATGGSSIGRLVVEGCSWVYNTTKLRSVPIKDGGGVNLYFDQDFSRTIRTNIAFFSNTQYLINTTQNDALPNAFGKPIFIAFGSILTQFADTGFTFEEADGRFCVTIPHTAFQTAALTKTLTIGQAQEQTKIESVSVEVKTALGGTAGTLTLEVGHDADIDAFIVSSDVKTAATFLGDAGAELGVALATPVQGGYWVPKGTTRSIQAKLTSGSGNLSGLTTGTVRIQVDYKSALL